MKRVLEVLAVALLVAGIELATGAVSYGLDQVLRVARHLVAGSEPDVSPVKFFVGVGMMVVGAGLVILDFWARAYSGFVVRSKLCPHCGIKAERVRRRRRHRILSWALGERVTYRKCKTCGWHGLTGGI